MGIGRGAPPHSLLHPGQGFLTPRPCPDWEIGEEEVLTPRPRSRPTTVTEKFYSPIPARREPGIPYPDHGGSLRGAGSSHPRPIPT